MIRSLDGVNFAGSRVLLRCDFNVPMDGGKVRDRSRLEAHGETIERLVRGGGRVLLLSHLGRPKGREADKSLRLLLADLEEIYGLEVKWLGGILETGVEDRVSHVGDGELGLFENIRFYAEEEAGDEQFAELVSKRGDIFVNDAFSVSHRLHSSVSILPRLLPSFGGMSLIREVRALDGALEGKGKVMAVIGGSKVSTKLGVLKGLLERVDTLAVVGAMVHTFLLLRGYELGESLVESEMLDDAMEIEEQARRRGVELLLAEDVVVEGKDGVVRMCGVDSIRKGETALDVGEVTLDLLSDGLMQADKVLWNGPLGRFEDERFGLGTSRFAEMFCGVTSRGGFTLAGGGDTVAALVMNGFDVYDREKISYVSMAGGAFLERLEGRELPGIEFLIGKE